MANQEMAFSWQAVGVILAVLIFSGGVAWLMRSISTSKLPGQKFSMAALGVAGVVGISALRVGWEDAGFVILCFSVAALPIGIEYYTRLMVEQKKALEEAEKLVDGNARADR